MVGAGGWIVNLFYGFSFCVVVGFFYYTSFRLWGLLFGCGIGGFGVTNMLVWLVVDVGYVEVSGCGETRNPKSPPYPKALSQNPPGQLMQTRTL